MNPLVLQFANGNVFFVGLGLVMVTTALSCFHCGRWIRSLTCIAWIVGILLVLASGTPLDQGLYVGWLLISIAGFLLLNLKYGQQLRPRRRYAITGITIICSSALIFLELPYHRTQSVTISSTQPVFVIGDSITAGIGSTERTWPQVLAERAHLNVKNLAQPGATAAAALNQAARVDQTRAVVFVEIGGNDLLGGTGLPEFRQKLDELLGKISEGGNQVVMFEIPLIPFFNAFGAEQRTLAKKYHVTLLPKYFLTRVFGIKGGTMDGLHLSQAGHDALAAEVQKVLQIK